LILVNIDNILLIYENISKSKEQNNQGNKDKKIDTKLATK
jgi:hypothetical protein